MGKPNKFDPVAAAKKSAERVLLGADGKQAPLTTEIMQEIAKRARGTKQFDPTTGNELGKFDVFQNMLFNQYGANSTYALLAIGTQGNRPNVPADDEGRFNLFQEKVSEGIKLVKTEPLSVYTAVTLQSLDYVKARNADGGVANLKPIAAALDRLQTGVSDIAKKGDLTADATTALKDIGLGQREIEFIAIAAATQRALKDTPQASYQDIVSKAEHSAVTFQDLKDFSETYSAAANGTDPKATWLIQNLSDFLSQNNIDPKNAFNLKNSDASRKRADAGGPEPDTTAGFRAARADVTTSAAADPAAPAVTRRPDAPATAPA